MVLEGWLVSAFPPGKAEPSRAYLFVINICVQNALALLLVGRVARRSGFSFSFLPPAATARAEFGQAFRAYASVLPALLLLLGLSSLLNRWLGIRPSPQPLVGYVLGRGGVGPAVLLVGAGVVLAPLAEEIVFRGFLYPALRKRFSAAAAIVISSAFFALLHFDPYSWPVIAGLGVFLAWVYERTGRLSTCVLIHAIHNSLFLAYALIRAAL